MGNPGLGGADGTSLWVTVLKAQSGDWLVLWWRLRCVQSSDLLEQGGVFADRFICMELSDLPLTDPAPTSSSGFVNLR